MKRNDNVIVLKFGSSVLRDVNDLPRAVKEIQRWRRDYQQVFAVVSAFGDTTDCLLRLARSVSSNPEPNALAVLLASGEATSSALLGLALSSAGVPNRVLDANQAGLRTSGSTLDAELIGADATRLLSDGCESVVVLPGFVGRDAVGATTLLGRGGSDYSALFLAHCLNADCLLLKDVDGLYSSDPALDPTAVRFEQVSYTTALRHCGSLVQEKAVRFASELNLRFAISSIGADCQTLVGPLTDRLQERLATESFRVPRLQTKLEECIA